jgi:hypothetical protein
MEPLRPTVDRNVLEFESYLSRLPISAFGQKRKAQNEHIMSALPPKADIDRRNRHVRFVPIATERIAAKANSCSITSSAMACSVKGMGGRRLSAVAV